MARAELRDRGKKLDSLILSKFLDNYAETGEKYVEVLQKIFKQKNIDYDKEHVTSYIKNNPNKFYVGEKMLKYKSQELIKKLDLI